MNRCVALLAALTLLPAAAFAQRNFPATALRGEMVVVQPPVIEMNRQPAQLAPGARIYDQNNMMQVSGALVGQKFLVNYTRDMMGQPLTVWILTPAEAANKPWPWSAAQAQAWSFNASTQTWTKP